MSDDEDAHETDQWGYAETEYLPAFRITDLTHSEAEAPPSRSAGLPMLNRKHKRLGWRGSRQPLFQSTHIASPDTPTTVFRI